MLLSVHVTDQCSIFSTVHLFSPNFGLLLELHALTLVACSYALLTNNMVVDLSSSPHLLLCH